MDKAHLLDINRWSLLKVRLYIAYRRDNYNKITSTNKKKGMGRDK